MLASLWRYNWNGGDDIGGGHWRALGSDMAAETVIYSRNGHYRGLDQFYVSHASRLTTDSLHDLYTNKVLKDVLPL